MCLYWVGGTLELIFKGRRRAIFYPEIYRWLLRSKTWMRGDA